MPEGHALEEGWEGGNETSWGPISEEEYMSEELNIEQFVRGDTQFANILQLV